MEAKKVWAAVLIACGISAIVIGVLNGLYLLFALMIVEFFPEDFDISSTVWNYPVTTIIVGGMMTFFGLFLVKNH